ncbi:MAG: DUF4139 domain-containing protein [Deltaproteobacteria bacterium]|nr:DUF4139 domain-containing protein [Deltaproteobacteria bacterium]
MVGSTTCCRRVVAAVLGVLSLAAVAPAQESPRIDVRGDARTKVNVTVYNAGVALVREVREVDLPRGTTAVRWQDVAAQIRPETVFVGDPGEASTFAVLEQNYKYDLLTPTRLMELYVDRQLTLVTADPDSGVEEMEQATLLSTEGYQYVYRTDEGITFNHPGRVVFPEVPPNFVQRPTLEWLLDSHEAGRRPVEASYLTYGMSWSADYVLVLGDDETQGDLTGWVTLRNDSGIGFAGAGLQLVAGHVNIVTPPPLGTPAEPIVAMRMAALEPMAPPPPAFVEEGMFEYHLYTLQRPTDVADREQKQIELLSSDRLTIDKKYRLEGSSYWYVSEQSGPFENLPVDVWLEFRNVEESGLGIPMPAGVVRVYKADSSGSEQFIGEDAIQHTPREERVKLRLGQAFDIVADRRQTDYEILTNTLWETAWEVKIRNHKDESVVVELREPMGGDWEVVSSSHEWFKESSSLCQGLRPTGSPRVISTDPDGRGSRYRGGGASTA